VTKTPKNHPGSASKGQASRDARAERQAKALRDNLRRRKQQARGRETELDETAGDSLTSSDKTE
jgi:hypothetical protein